MTKKIYYQTVLKWAAGIGIPSAAAIFLIFNFLISGGLIEVHNVSGDMVCAGTEEDLCYTIINFTANEDIFIYRVDYDPWGRDTPFEFEPGIKDWKLQRSWGTGWRNIPLDESCTGTWCGAPSSTADVAYSIVFREGRTYTIRIVGYKINPSDTIKWSFNPEGYWLPVEDKDYSLYMECKDITRTRWVQKSREVWSEENQTNELEFYYENEEYLVEVCTEIGVKVGDKEILYKQQGKNCLRTENILCCWDNRDGGTNIAGRKGEARITIYSGESGTCVDLENSLDVIETRSDFGEVVIE